MAINHNIVTIQIDGKTTEADGRLAQLVRFLVEREGAIQTMQRGKLRFDIGPWDIKPWLTVGMEKLQGCGTKGDA